MLTFLDSNFLNSYIVSSTYFFIQTPFREITLICTRFPYLNCQYLMLGLFKTLTYNIQTYSSLPNSNLCLSHVLLAP